LKKKGKGACTCSPKKCFKKKNLRKGTSVEKNQTGRGRSRENPEDEQEKETREKSWKLGVTGKSNARPSPSEGLLKNEGQRGRKKRKWGRGKQKEDTSKEKKKCSRTGTVWSFGVQGTRKKKRPLKKTLKTLKRPSTHKTPLSTWISQEEEGKGQGKSAREKGTSKRGHKIRESEKKVGWGGGGGGGKTPKRSLKKENFPDKIQGQR